MAARSIYASWHRDIDAPRRDVRATVRAALEGSPDDWAKRMEESGALDTITDEYIDAINTALASLGVRLENGEEFHGPPGMDAYARIMSKGLIVRAVEQVSLHDIIERHDIDIPKADRRPIPAPPKRSHA